MADYSIYILTFFLTYVLTFFLAFYLASILTFFPSGACDMRFASRPSPRRLDLAIWGWWRAGTEVDEKRGEARIKEEEEEELHLCIYRDPHLAGRWGKMWWFHLGWGLSPFFLRPLKHWNLPMFGWITNIQLHVWLKIKPWNYSQQSVYRI